MTESHAVVTSDPLPVVTADLLQMTQLLQNLVANAVKFHGPRSPKIHVGAQRKERAWEIHVRDNGIGIDPQYFDRIFLIFQRLHTRTQYKGTGIGLAVCKKIVERHGGKIWVESVPGDGIDFLLHHSRQRRSGMSPIQTRPIQILLVEDSPSDAKLTISALKLAKVANELHHVEDGVQAMEFLKRQGKYEKSPRPDLILLDLNLPRKDGREVLEELKEDPNFTNIPVIVLTTSSAEKDVLRSYKLHCNCYVTKPVNFDRFLECVRSIEHFWLSVVVLPTKE